MILDLHPQIRVQKLSVGSEQTPLLVIDNFVADPERLVRRAATRMYGQGGRYFPGIRAEAPLSYQQLFTEKLRDLLFQFFSLQGTGLKFALCHYSVVTTPPAQLEFLQRIPHIDSTNRNALASVHYLFRGDFGGTGFYRHRATGFESISPDRSEGYFKLVSEESKGPNAPEPAYINDDTPLYERIAMQDGIFNRIVIYPRNVLHSGCIGPDFVADPDPTKGRLSINTFIDVLP